MYYGLLKNADEAKSYELILCANIIPKERKVFLETIGIDCKELGIAQISGIASKHDYTFIDDRQGYKGKGKLPAQLSKVDKAFQPSVENTNIDEVSVWMFQGNPKMYDIVNALSDPEIGNTIHWTVSQNKNKIRKGHLAMIWMSGEEAGIYALGRIETDPEVLNEPEEEKNHWLESDTMPDKLRVRITIIRKLINKPVLRVELKAIQGLSNLSILKQPIGTNFPVRDNEWEIIASLI